MCEQDNTHTDAQIITDIYIYTLTVVVMGTKVLL